MSFRHPLADAALVVRLPVVIVRDDGYEKAGSARPVFERVRDTGRRLVPGHHDLAGVLESSLERDRREKGRFAPCLRVDKLGERNLARFPGNEVGMADPQRNKKSRLRHLFGRKLDAESPLFVGPNDARAVQAGGIRRVRATDGTLQKDLGAPTGLPVSRSMTWPENATSPPGPPSDAVAAGLANSRPASTTVALTTPTAARPDSVRNDSSAPRSLGRRICLCHMVDLPQSPEKSRPISYTLQAAPTTGHSKRSMVGCHADIGFFSLPRRPCTILGLGAEPGGLIGEIGYVGDLSDAVPCLRRLERSDTSEL